MTSCATPFMFLPLTLFMMLQIHGVHAGGHHGAKAAPQQPSFMANMDEATKTALQANLDGAIKIYLNARGKLQPADMTNSGLEPAKPKPMNKVQKRAARAKAASDLAKGWHPAAPCSLPDGCVNEAAKTNFLHAKYIPGSDNIFSPYFYKPGHMFVDKRDVDADFRSYILSRPKTSVPKEARALLMPEGDDMWPGGDGSNRLPYYPKAAAGDTTPFFELDIDPLASETGGSALLHLRVGLTRCNHPVDVLHRG